MKETEITVQVFNSLEEIDNILVNQGFEKTRIFQLNDWYFTKLDDVQNVSFIDLINNSFLVRQLISNTEKLQLCYKQKQVDRFNNVIAEEKFVSQIGSLAETLKIFNLCGLNNYCTIKNHSCVYKKGITEFALQVVENLGIFIEFEEDESMLGMDEQQKINYMFSILKSLNLKLGDDHSCKKVMMMLNR